MEHIYPGDRARDRNVARDYCAWRGDGEGADTEPRS